MQNKIAPQGNFFILAGNGSYRNRGCEAIVRGTAKILRRYFKDPEFLVCSQFGSEDHLETQRDAETDPSIRHVKINFLPQAENKTLNRALWRFYQCVPRWRMKYIYRGIQDQLRSARAVLSVGGDNYSLDYGTLSNWTDLDETVLAENKKLIIWGATIGPFSSAPSLERGMAAHFKRPAAILARDSWTVAYLSSLAVEENVYEVRDPAFVMDAEEPREFPLHFDLENTIGLNFSPFMAKTVCAGNSARWLDLAAQIVKSVKKTFRMPILLIPHVMEEHDNDYIFLKKISDRLADPDISVLSDHYSAAQTKWFISRCKVMAGARMHSLIAGFSSHVPTLCFAYSKKSESLAEDVYGKRDLCLQAEELRPPQVCAALARLIQDEAPLRRALEEKMPSFKEDAYRGGAILSSLLAGASVTELKQKFYIGSIESAGGKIYDNNRCAPNESAFKIGGQ